MTGRGTKGSDENRSKSKKYKRQEKGTSKNDDNCKECNKLRSSEVKALNCNFCHKWVCADCLKISDVLYEMWSIIQVPPCWFHARTVVEGEFFARYEGYSG